MRQNRDRRQTVRWMSQIGAILLLLAIAYPFSCGPAAYCMARGWMSPKVFDALYRPINVISARLHGYRR